MTTKDLVELYRPAGKPEIELVRASGWTRWPPRLPEQPIFYPVLTKEYASHIARNWNATDRKSDFKGYVAEFHIDRNYLSRFDVHKVGGPQHLEYWIPAEQLADFNEHIVGSIAIIREFTCNDGGEHDAFEDDLDEAVRKWVPRDTDPSYTENIVSATKEALRDARSAVLRSSANGKVQLTFFDADRNSLLQWDIPSNGPERWQLAIQWAEVMKRHGRLVTVSDERAT